VKALFTILIFAITAFSQNEELPNEPLLEDAMITISNFQFNGYEEPVFFLPTSFMDSYSQNPSLFDKRQELVTLFSEECDSACHFPVKVTVKDSALKRLSTIGSKYFDSSLTYWGAIQQDDSTVEWKQLDSLDAIVSFSIEDIHCDNFFFIDIELACKGQKILFFVGLHNDNYGQREIKGWSTSIIMDSLINVDTIDVDTSDSSISTAKRMREFFIPKDNDIREFQVTRLLLLDKEINHKGDYLEVVNSKLLGIIKNGDTTQILNMYPICDGHMGPCSAELGNLTVLDANGDGLWDFFYSNFIGVHYLLIQREDGTFDRIQLNSDTRTGSC